MWLPVLSRPKQTHRNYRPNEKSNNKKISRHVDFYIHLLHGACLLSKLSLSIQAGNNSKWITKIKYKHRPIQMHTLCPLFAFGRLFGTHFFSTWRLIKSLSCSSFSGLFDDAPFAFLGLVWNKSFSFGFFFVHSDKQCSMNTALFVKYVLTCECLSK